MSTSKLNLTELVTAIRNDLENLDQERIMERKAPLFRIETLELEINFVVERTHAGKGGFDIKVLSLGGETSIRSEEVQKVLLKFKVPPEAKEILGARAHSSSPQDPGPDVLPIE